MQTPGCKISSLMQQQPQKGLRKRTKCQTKNLSKISAVRPEKKYIYMLLEALHKVRFPAQCQEQSQSSTKPLSFSSSLSVSLHSSQRKAPKAAEPDKTMLFYIQKVSTEITHEQRIKAESKLLVLPLLILCLCLNKLGSFWNKALMVLFSAEVTTLKTSTHLKALLVDKDASIT